MVTESADMMIEDVSCIGSNRGCLNLAASEVTSEQVKCAYHCKAAVVMSSVLIKFNCQRIINDFAISDSCILCSSRLYCTYSNIT